MTVQQCEQEVVIQLDKRLNVNNSQELKEMVLRLFGQGYRRITLDFSRASMIDASGLGKIIALQKKLNEQQGELRLINVINKYVQRVFDLVQLEKVVNIS